VRRAFLPEIIPVFWSEKADSRFDDADFLAVFIRDRVLQLFFDKKFRVAQIEHQKTLIFAHIKISHHFIPDFGLPPAKSINGLA
jgi:hypothetical protein